jgi:hypothetical protein
MALYIENDDDGFENRTLEPRTKQNPGTCIQGTIVQVSEFCLNRWALNGGPISLAPSLLRELQSFRYFYLGIGPSEVWSWMWRWGGEGVRPLFIESFSPFVDSVLSCFDIQLF